MYIRYQDYEAYGFDQRCTRHHLKLPCAQDSDPKVRQPTDGAPPRFPCWTSIRRLYPRSPGLGPLNAVCYTCPLSHVIQGKGREVVALALRQVWRQGPG